jgi:type IV fimbrial biogenesis protein FimT
MRSHLRPGFSLIETMIALAISTLLLATAMPGFEAVVSTSRINSAAGELSAALHLARNEAIRSNRGTVFCRSADLSTCADGAGAWAGWIVFVDGNGNGQREAAEELTRSGSIDGPLAGYSSTNIAALNNRIVFQPDGRARGSDGLTALNGSIALCIASHGGSDNVRQLNIAFGGRTTVLKTSNIGACAAPADA